MLLLLLLTVKVSISQKINKSLNAILKTPIEKLEFFYGLVFRFQCIRITKFAILIKGNEPIIICIFVERIPTSTSISIIKLIQDNPTIVKTLFGVF